MGLTRLNLVAIRSANIDRAAEFYENLGLEFEKHRHGNGPEHYSCECHEVVFEIYRCRSTRRTQQKLVSAFQFPTWATRCKTHSNFLRRDCAAQGQPMGVESRGVRFDGHRIELIEDKRLSGVQAASAVDG